MLETYLRRDETIESRLDEALNAARVTNNTTLKTLHLAEAQVLATIAQTTLAPVATIESAPVYHLSTSGDTVFTPDEVMKALDNAFEGGQAPVALRGAVLALLAGDAEHDRLAAFVADSSLVPDDPDGRSAMVEYSGVPDGPRPTVDRSGVDFEETIPEHDAEEEMADRFERNGPEYPDAPKIDADDFPEFDKGHPKTKKKGGGKKSAAQRAAEEAGL